MNYILLNIIINSILVGVILMTQFINYPLFKSIKSDFTNYHKIHRKNGICCSACSNIGYIYYSTTQRKFICNFYFSFNNYYMGQHVLYSSSYS